MPSSILLLRHAHYAHYGSDFRSRKTCYVLVSDGNQLLGSEPIYFWPTCWERFKIRCANQSGSCSMLMENGYNGFLQSCFTEIKAFISSLHIWERWEIGSNNNSATRMPRKATTDWQECPNYWALSCVVLWNAPWCFSRCYFDEPRIKICVLCNYQFVQCL